MKFVYPKLQPFPVFCHIQLVPSGDGMTQLPDKGHEDKSMPNFQLVGLCSPLNSFWSSSIFGNLSSFTRIENTEVGVLSQTRGKLRRRYELKGNNDGRWW